MAACWIAETDTQTYLGHGDNDIARVTMMTANQFLSTLKSDDKLRRFVAHLITQDLVHYIHSPVRFESDHVQASFLRDVEEAIFQFRNPLDSLVFLRSKGWSHDHEMHQVMENAYRAIQASMEEVFADR